MKNDTPENPSDVTIRSYQEHFQKYVANTPQTFSEEEFKKWIDTFIAFLPNKANVLELGSAAGRDARYLRLHDIHVLCADVIPKALTVLSQDGFKTAYYDFRDPFPTEWSDTFDGLFANAVLLHASQDVFEKTLKSMRSIVKKNGIIAFSLLNGTGEEVAIRRIDAPRYFKYHTMEELEKLLSNLGYEILLLQSADNAKWLQAIVRNI